jgi:tetratricopeptide (TPR) repeat protein
MKVALTLNPEPPDWYWFAFFSSHFMRGQYEEALDMALRAQNEDFYWVHCMQAAAYGKLGMEEEARTSVRRLLALYPDFPSQAGAEVARWLSPKRSEEVLDLLRQAGLDVE